MSLYKECCNCEGTGVAILSNCCNALFDQDYMLCSECLENIGDNDCLECNGQGKILKHKEHDEY